MLVLELAGSTGHLWELGVLPIATVWGILMVVSLVWAYATAKNGD
jgi:hypothetical protein